MEPESETVARTHMLIRRPVAEVFQAFIDPTITSRFWFTRGSGRVEPGAKLQWHWDMYGATGEVTVDEVEPNRRIRIRWPTPVEWEFSPRGEDATWVVITASGFTGTDDERVARAIDSMGGFSFVLAGCKAWMEHGIELKLVRDFSPDTHVTGWSE